MEVDGFPLEMFPRSLTKSRGFWGWVRSLGSVRLSLVATSWLWCLLSFLPYFGCLGLSVPQFPSLPFPSTEAVCGHGWGPPRGGTRGQEAVPPPVTVTAWCPPGWGSSHEGCFSFAKLQSICFPGRKAFYYYYYHYYYFFLLHLERASIPRRHPRGPALAEIRCSFGDKSWGKISIKVDAL